MAIMSMTDKKPKVNIGDNILLPIKLPKNINIGTHHGIIKKPHIKKTSKNNIPITPKNLDKYLIIPLSSPPTIQADEVTRNNNANKTICVVIMLNFLFIYFILIFNI